MFLEKERGKKKPLISKLTPLSRNKFKNSDDDDDEDKAIPAGNPHLSYGQHEFQVARNSYVECNFILQPLNLTTEILYSFVHDGACGGG